MSVVITTKKEIIMEILNSPVFKGINEREFEQMKREKCIRDGRYRKNDVIFSSGEAVKEFGTVKSGSVNVESLDLWGNRTILGNVEKGGVFAESYAVSGEALRVDAVAAEDSEILFFNIRKMLSSMESFDWYTKMLRNLLIIASKKNLTLSERIFCTAPKTLRGRLFRYLSSQSVINGAMEFEIPFNRQEMADYLNADRSALSNELSKMRSDGILDYRKNRFKLYKTEEQL